MEFQRLDQYSSKPLYLQIVEVIEQKIKNGEFPVDKKIPSQEYLRKVFNVSRDTIQEAFSSLVREGYVARRPRIGTVVISSTPDKGVALKRKNEICLVVSPFKSSGHGIFLDNLMNGVEEQVSKKGAFLFYNTIKEDKFSLMGKEKDIAGLWF